MFQTSSWSELAEEENAKDLIQYMRVTFLNGSGWQTAECEDAGTAFALTIESNLVM